MAAKKKDTMPEISQVQIEELRAADERLQNVLAERRAGKSKNALKGETQIGSLTFRYETVRCGKENCTKCPHGPYWYAYWKEGGRTHSRYVGRSLPGAARAVYEKKLREKIEK